MTSIPSMLPAFATGSGLPPQKTLGADRARQIEQTVASLVEIPDMGVLMQLLSHTSQPT